MKTFTTNFFFKMSQLIHFPQRVPFIVSFFLAISVSLLTVSSQSVEKKICQTEECLAAAKNLRESMNLNADPCDDFYKYACGNWLQSYNKSGRVSDKRSKEVSDAIYDFLKQNNSNNEPEAVHKARNYFSLCMNKAAYNSKLLEPIENILQKIGLPVLPLISNETINDDYNTLLPRAARFTDVTMYFNIVVEKNYYNNTLNLITLRRGSTLQKNGLRNQTFQIAKLFCKDRHSDFCTQLSTEDEFVKNLQINEILNQRTEIVEAIGKPSSKLNFSLIEVYTLEQLQNFTDRIAAEVNSTIPTLNWTRYIEEIFTDLDNVTLDLRDPNKVQITILEVDEIKEVIKLIHKSKSTKIIELELWWEVVLNLIPYVNPSIGEAYNCSDKTIEIFGMAVSYVFATKEEYIKAKAEVPTLFKHISESFQQIINQTSWMDEITRQRALNKLQSLNANIVYPSKIKSTPSFLNDIYEDMQITNNFFDTWISIIQSRITKNLKKLNQINADRHKANEWTQPPSVIDAQNRVDENTVYIYAGIIGTPYYYNGLHALDYGAMGFIIGHEIAHGFDNFGRRFNEEANLENWWQPETEIKYKEKAKCFKQAYENYNLISGNITLMGDSKLTLGEDLSDNAGFKAALFAYRKCVSVSGEESLLPQFENFSHEQLLTLGFAHEFCEIPTESRAEFYKRNDHSPKGVRINAVLRNSKEFSEIWKCSKGSNMNPSDDKCTVW